LYGLLRGDFDKWQVLIGGRFDNRSINQMDSLAFSASYYGVNYSSGFAYLGDKSTVRFNVSSGFRAPTTSELLSDGIHHGAFRYEIGNDSLRTEKAIQIDASYGVHLDDFELLINPFFNHVRDYIYLERVDSAINNFDVYQYNQANYAILYGVDFGFHYHPHFAHWIHLESSFSNIFAENENKTPLPLIPQSRINTQLKFEFEMKKKFKIENLVVQHIYYFKQNRTGVSETSSPSYHILNFGVNLKIEMKNPIFISMGARNILNEEFIDHLSGLKNLGLPSPGVNAYFKVRYEFGTHLKHNHK
jgi:iron complex outermembrane receptor protein